MHTRSSLSRWYFSASSFSSFASFLSAAIPFFFWYVNCVSSSAFNISAFNFSYSSLRLPELNQKNSMQVCHPESQNISGDSRRKKLTCWFLQIILSFPSGSSLQWIQLLLGKQENSWLWHLCLVFPAPEDKHCSTQTETDKIKGPNPDSLKHLPFIINAQSSQTGKLITYISIEAMFWWRSLNQSREMTFWAILHAEHSSHRSSTR